MAQETGASTPTANPTPMAPAMTATARSPSIPVVLHEAALDSPSFRATALHFADQVEAIERWLDGFAKATSRLSHEVQGLEATMNEYLSKVMPPNNIGSVDHDYTALALNRFSEGSRDWWMQILAVARKMEQLSAEPIRNFLQNDLRPFKDSRRNLEQTQKTFDSALARYVSQSKTKEPSALREDAFAAFETRKTYLKASLDYCQMAPQLRLTLDKLLIRMTTDLWREMKRSRDSSGAFAKWSHEMDRVRGWSRDMELSESTFKRQLQAARREIGESTLQSCKPSRELDSYSASTVPFLGSRGPMNLKTDDQSAVVSEKQGWLFLRMLSGKPVRTNWIRRWFYCRDGIFGWLVNGPQGVLQGDEIGVLLCNAKPAVSEERRFCFEVKTKNQTMLLQAETQAELMEWLEVFEVAKKRAFEASVTRDNSSFPGGVDPAFAITPPSMPEFSAKSLDAQLKESGDEPAPGHDRTSTLPVPNQEAVRSSFDVGMNPPRRTVSALVRDEGESSREHAARIMQKLDLHRRSGVYSTTDTTALASPAPTGGIASLISASHSFLPGVPITSSRPYGAPLPSGQEPQSSSLAPATLAKAPAPTSLSRTAVVYSGDRAFANESGTIPTAILANYWGSNAWAQDYAPSPTRAQVGSDDPFGPNSPSIKVTTFEDGTSVKSPTASHKKAISMDANIDYNIGQDSPVQEQFPANYPTELKTNMAQFRLLFPTVPLDEKLVLVFRAAWTSTSEPDSKTPPMAGNGRIYVTSDNMYFYGHQMGLVVAYAVALDSITEVTAAPGKDCDFIFLHLIEHAQNNGYSRITIKTFLEDLKLLHARLNLLIDDLQAEEPMDLPQLTDALINLERGEDEKRSPSLDSWEEVSVPADDATAAARAVSSPRTAEFIRSQARGARRPVTKLQLPSHPVHYEPEDMQRKVTERHFEISAKACFHVLFGDKSFVFPKLYFERRAKEIAQGPWSKTDADHLQRLFKFKVEYASMLGTRNQEITDEQTIDIFEDHVTYCVTHVKTPWHLPHAKAFKLVTKIVITHVAKSKCNLAIYTKVAWSKTPTLAKHIIERQALDDADRDAEELAEVATEQVRRIGPHGRTKRAIQIYGNIGHQTRVLLFTPAEADSMKKTRINPRTLTSLFYETIRSIAESVASTVMMGIFAVLRKAWGVLSAQRLLLIWLAFSLLANVIFSSYGTWTWWTERKAADFMQRLGIGPNIVMSKAIYLVDLDEAAKSSTIQTSWPQDSYCYDTFQSIANSTDVDAPFDESGSSLSSGASRAVARRLKRTRQRLGSYRHDLLVAMRMVNSLERETMISEWENFLVDENHRCDQMQAVLRAWNATPSAEGKQKSGKEDKGTQRVLAEQDGRKREALQLWYEDYCGSCRRDRDVFMSEREGFSLL